MTAKSLLNSLLLFLTAALFAGCFKEDTPIDPVTRKGISISVSMYDYQSYYDLSSDSVTASPNSRWDLAFQSSPGGWQILINSSNYLGIYRTGITNFETTQFDIDNSLWVYDASSGNPDSTAIGRWHETAGEGQQVYLLGKYDGVRYRPFKKLKFMELTDSTFRFQYANLNHSDFTEAIVKKDDRFNFIYYSINQGSTVYVEPEKNRWDLLFTQYTTTLYTDAGIPTPYIVRGVYLNPNQVSVMLDTITGYENISSGNIASHLMRSTRDFIGYNWKAVEINQSTNTARYAVRRNYSYIIRDTDGNYFKLRFLSYVNDSLKVGYPTFEKEKLK